MDERFKAFSRPTQALGILELSPAEKLLVVLPPELGTKHAFSGNASHTTVWHHDFAISHLEHGEDHFFSLLPPPGPFDLALIYLPKARDYQRYIFSLLHSSFAENARVIVVGSKQSGAASAKKLLSNFLDVREKQAARHCIAWDCRASRSAVASIPALSSPEKYFDVSAWDQRAHIASLPGVFAHGKLDDGTRFLLDTLNLHSLKFKKVLDWGCGSGTIGTLVKLASPESQVDFSDVNAMALESTRLTLAANKTEGSTIIASDVFSNFPDKVDLIITNPPAHKGLMPDHSMSERFLAEAPKHLKPGGRVILVTNAHLPYIKIMNKEFKRVTILSKTPRFHVIEGKI